MKKELGDTSNYDKNSRDTRDSLAANGWILEEDADGTCRIKSFAKGSDETDSE